MFRFMELSNTVMKFHKTDCNTMHNLGEFSEEAWFEGECHNDACSEIEDAPLVMLARFKTSNDGAHIGKMMTVNIQQAMEMRIEFCVTHCV